MTARRWIVGLITIAAIAVFAVTLVHALWYAPDSEVPAPQLAVHAADVPEGQLPDRLVIPKIGIDAHVKHVGVDAKGNMATPGNFTDVAWYKYGTPPGYNGSAVIDGHVDNGLALAGVFKHLDELSVGDDVYIRTASSTTLHFKVVERDEYDYKQVPLDKLFNRSDGAYLNLITCGGTFIPTEKSYDHRLVIYTKLVS
ncbi:MAG: class F sortase [Candidatus Kaiserbacteria bacterium]|nr:class F sortase [Candidatus Kaiserbacteria bacterium]